MQLYEVVSIATIVFAAAGRRLYKIAEARLGFEDDGRLGGPKHVT